MKKNTKKIIFILIAIIVIVSVIFYIYLFLNEYKAGKNLQKNSLVPEERRLVENNLKGDVLTRRGYLVKVNEKSIDFIGLEKNPTIISNEEKEKRSEMFNLILTDPATIITRGDFKIRKRVEFSELEIGQEVFIEYDKNTKNLISININEKNIVQIGEKEIDLADIKTLTTKITSISINFIKATTSDGKEFILSVPQTGASFVQQITQKDGSFIEKEIGLLEVPINKDVEIQYNSKTNEVMLVIIK